MQINIYSTKKVKKMLKFNVGDRVKVIVSEIDGRQAYGYVSEMDEDIGKVFTISLAEIEQMSKLPYYTFEEGRGWIWDERCLRRVRKAKVEGAVEAVEGTHPDNDAPLHVKYAKLSSELTKAVDDDPGTCSWAIQHSPDNLEFHAEAPCHAGLEGYKNRDGDGKKQALLLNISGHLSQLKKDGCGKSYLEYCRYILEESPHAKAFVYTGLKDAVEYGVFMNVNKNINQLAVAAVALREGSEYSSKLQMFSRLREEGHCGHTAYLLSYCVSSTLQWNSFNESHRTIAPDCDSNEVLSSFKDGFRAVKGPAYKNSTVPYSGIAKHLGRRQSKNNVADYFCKLLRVVRKDGWLGGYEQVLEEDLQNAAKELDEYFTKE